MGVPNFGQNWQISGTNQSQFSFNQLPIAFVPVFDNFDGVLYIAIYRYNVTFFVLALWKYNDDEGMMMIW